MRICFFLIMLLTSFAFLSFSTPANAITCNPNSEICADKPCDSLGSSTMDRDGANVIVCAATTGGNTMTKDCSDGCTWKSMTSTTSFGWISVSNGTLASGPNNLTYLVQALTPHQICVNAGYKEATGACIATYAGISNLQGALATLSWGIPNEVSLDCLLGSQINQASGQNLKILCLK